MGCCQSSRAKDDNTIFVPQEEKPETIPVSNKDNNVIKSESRRKSSSESLRNSLKLFKPKKSNSMVAKKPPPSLRQTKRFSSINPETCKPLNVASNVTKEELESWSDSNTGFEIMMANPYGRTLFGNYLLKEFSCDNLKFWRETQKMKEVQNREEFQEKAEYIFKNFLEKSSPNEVSLDFKVKEKLLLERQNPPEDIFEEASKRIYSLMHRDSFPRFLVSDFFREIQTQSSTQESSEFTNSPEPLKDKISSDAIKLHQEKKKNHYVKM